MKRLVWYKRPDLHFLHVLKGLFIIGGVIFALLCIIIVLLNKPYPEKITYGVTYSYLYAQALGLDPRQTYLDIIQDLKVKNIRLPIYWSRVEKSVNYYDFSEVDWQIQQAEKHRVNLIVAIGKKLPRWPECYLPDHLRYTDKKTQDKYLLNFIQIIVNRYKSSPSIIMWQVENEPFLPFGECQPETDLLAYKRKVSLVRTLDTRPVSTADSGELSEWLRTGALVDILGISLYRDSWSPLFGNFIYPFPPAIYALKAKLVSFIVPKIIVSELQMEPWADKFIGELSIEKQQKLFPLQKFLDNLNYGQRAGFDTIYLWGVEWWALQKQNKYNDYWEASRPLF